MSSTSKSFYIEAIDDGSTLHGQLLSTKPLTQAWTGQAAVPSWTDTNNQPIIFVDLLSGSTKVSPDKGGTWSYNGVPIVWADNSATATSQDGLFQKVDNYPSSSSPTAAIKVIGNLASANNVNSDSISYEGSYTMAGAAVGFSVSTLVRITGITASGIVGMIEFENGNVITSDNQEVVAYPRLFGSDGTEITTGYTVEWKLGDEPKGNGTNVDGKKNALKITANDITDNTIVECTFTYTMDGASLTFTAHESVDDQTDPEQMYIQYNGGNATSATLRRGESITWQIWMGKQNDPAVDTSWTDFKVRLLNAAGETITKEFSGTQIPDVTSGSIWRSLTTSGGKATLTISYDTVASSDFNKYMTAFVEASKSSS